MELNKVLNNIMEKATDLAQSGVAKSKQLAEIAKLKTSNMAEEDTIKKAYIEIGKLYYAEMGLAPEGAYAAACEKITAARAAIEANNDRIAELREQSPDLLDSDIELELQVESADPEAATAEDFADAPETPAEEPQAPVEEPQTPETPAEEEAPKAE